jgi:hypothetical protein
VIKGEGVLFMWETSRFRGNGNGSRSGGSGNGGQGRGTMRMKRVQAQIVANHGWGVPATVVSARLILNDLGPKSVTVFAQHSIELGQQVTFTLEHPRPLMVRGKVTYCALLELSPRIQGNAKLPYRLQVEFDFLNDGEALAVNEYVEELHRTDLSKAA